MLSSLAFRLAAMALKFIFIVVAASHLPAKEIALFGKTNGMILLLIYLIALDLYIATSRQITDKPEVFHTLLSNQILANGILFAAVAVCFFILSSADASIPIQLFLLLLLFELISQEFYRLNISFGDYVKANLLFFIKTGGWTAIASAGILMGRITTIHQVVLVWLTTAILATLFGWLSVRKYAKGFRFRPDMGLFFRPLRNNLLIFTSSLAMVALSNVDKIYLGSFGKADRVAAYVFFASVTGAATTLIYSGVVNPNYSKLVKPTITEAEIRKVIVRIGITSIGLLTFIAIALVLLIDPLLALVNRNYLETQKPLLVLVGLSAMFNALSLIPHFYLLAHKMDAQIAAASVLGIVAHLATIYPLFLLFGTPGVAISVSLGFATMLATKGTLSIRLAKKK